MKKLGILAVVIGVMTLLSGLPASAQDGFNFSVTFGFYAGNAKMPAGSYTLRRVGDEENAYELQNNATSHSVVLETRSSSRTAKGKVEAVFNRYGDTDYLQAILSSTGGSVDIIPSKAEQIAAKKATAQPHSVVMK
jgi:hypothetical protein